MAQGITYKYKRIHNSSLYISSRDWAHSLSINKYVEYYLDFVTKYKCYSLYVIGSCLSLVDTNFINDDCPKAIEFIVFNTLFLDVL